MADERVTLKRACDQSLRAFRSSGAPVWMFKVAGGRFQRAGVPDYIGCVAGRFVAVELKNPTVDKSQPSKLQAHVGELIRKAGGIFVVCRSRQCFEDAITNVIRSSVEVPTI